MMNVAIVEDEENQAELLKSYVKRYGEEKNIDFHFFCFGDAMDFLHNYKAVYDIVFMDIEMPYLNGMNAAKELRKIDKEVCLIFVTNIARYAIKGYSVDATDYMIKPISYSTFSFRMERAVAVAMHNNKQDIVITSNRSYYRINVNDILYVESRGHKVVYHTASEEIESWETLQGAAEKLGKTFVSPRTGVFVNLRYVKSIQGDNISLGEGHDLIRIARDKKREFINTFTVFVSNT
ncbi:MAG: response regulator transcription factor [Clostridia bacterium]|nr:response regulator transcription factor [Clostridia bacterium]